MIPPPSLRSSVSSSGGNRLTERGLSLGTPHAIRATLRRSSPGAPPRTQLGAVSFFHRFGSSLNVHPHYHLVVLDGVFGEDGGGRIEFHEADEVTTERIRKLESVLRRRVLRYFRRQGLLDELDALGVLYSYLFALLTLERYALLAGSLGLFAALAAVMYVTRGVNWEHMGVPSGGAAGQSVVRNMRAEGYRCSRRQ